MSANSGCKCAGSGGGTVTGTSCGCGAAGSVAAGAGALVRPKFFAGQLLTEDDLQQLVDYVVDKQRLHNRFLFGDGVACGLEVGCDPCDPGKVTVAPGYAIDCCGNDVVVTCPASVDILAMIRALRAQLRGGADCGDPCPADGQQDAGTGDDGGGGDQVARAKAARRKQGTRDRAYCLYIRYADEETEPVAPYTTDDACAGQSCEPTRVREGYRFELRCPGGGARPDDVLSHALACIGDFITSESSFAAARAITQQMQRIREAHQILDLYATHVEPISRGDDYKDELQRLSSELGYYLETFANRAEDPDGAFEAFRALACAVARWNVQDDKGKSALRTHVQFDPLDTYVTQAAQRVAAARSTLTDVVGKLGTEADRTVARELLALAEVWAPLVDQARKRDAYLSSYEALIFVAGAPHSVGVQSAFVDMLGELRRDLLQRVGESPRSHCDLVRRIDALLLPGPGAGNELRRADVEALASAVDALTEQLLRYFQDCFCAALNPSCASCDDPAVLLACLRVDGCEVVDICNLGRRWILSAANLRYWMGPLRVVTRLLEWACCTPIPPPTPPPPHQVQPEPKPDPGNEPPVINLARSAVASPGSPGAAARASLGRLPLVEVLRSPDFSSADLPDLLVGELARLYLPRGDASLRFADFARAADQLGRMVAARYGAPRAAKARAQVRDEDAAILQVLERAPVKTRVETLAVGALMKSVEDKRLDLGPALEKSADSALARLRAERDEAVRTELQRWASSEDGLARSVRPAIEQTVVAQLPELERRQHEDLERVVRNTGLDTTSMTQRIGAAVDAKVAALGLNRESLDARISSTMQGTLAANGLVADALGRRLDDSIRTRLDTEGLERDALDRRLTLAVKSALASEGFTATALGERIQAEVTQSFAREGLTGKTLEERVDGRIRAGIQPLLDSELKRYAASSSAAALDRVDALTKELEALRTEHAALVARLGSDGGGPAPAGAGVGAPKKEG